MVDAPVLGTGPFGGGGSSPLLPTALSNQYVVVFLMNTRRMATWRSGNAGVCKTSMRGFDSRRGLTILCVPLY